jgi:hypothetical protein
MEPHGDSGRGSAAARRAGCEPSCTGGTRSGNRARRNAACNGSASPCPVRAHTTGGSAISPGATGDRYSTRASTSSPGTACRNSSGPRKRTHSISAGTRAGRSSR